jgi:DNA polymerase delta subunit 1
MERYYRKKKIVKLKSSIEFQVLSWEGVDVETEDGDDKFYSIFTFGVNKDGESICTEFTGFTPFFYVKVSRNWDNIKLKQVYRVIRNKLFNKKHHLLSCKYVYKKDIYRFNNDKEFKYIRFLFDNYSVMKSAIWNIKKHNNIKNTDDDYSKYKITEFKNFKFELYNANIDPILVFSTIKKILMSGWLNITKYEFNERSRCQIDIKTNWKNVTYVEKNVLAPFITASFDIECYSKSGFFPDPDNKNDIITQIGTSFQKLGETNYQQHVVVLGDCDQVKGITIESCKTEGDLIKKWIKLIENIDPDQLIGYNIDGFDWKYINIRAKLHKVDISRLSRLYDVDSEYKDNTMQSSAYGINIFRFIKTPGVNQLDLLHWFRKETKLDSYTLDHVSETYLGDKKRDVNHHEIFKWSGPDGNSKSRAIVADYCAQDTLLPLRLMEKMCIFPNLIEMSKVTRIPITWVVSRGQQIRVFSQIFYEAWYKGYLIPSIKSVGESFKGATVLSAQRGVYFEPVSGLDFASLYPSIIIAHNLCITTLVRLPKYENLDGIDYEHFNWNNGHYEVDNNKKKEVREDKGDYIFVKNKKGLVPAILERLWEERKNVKKQMKQETDPFAKMILNGKQLAIKVSMNSIYGVFGAQRGFLPSCTPIAATTTYIGREMIKQSKTCAEEWYDGTEKSNGVKAIVRYGDSIPGYITVTKKNVNGDPIRVKVSKLLDNPWKCFNRYEGDGNIIEKEECRPDKDVYIWTKSGWSKLIRVVRHKTDKKIYRIKNKNGMVDVTEDHSLLTEDGKQIKPSDVNKHTKLMFNKF